MKSVLGAIFLFFLSFLTKAQNIEKNLEIYANDFPQERIYLHYDKSFYAPAETVWFKAYLMQGIFPADSSKNLYIDWTDEKGTLLLHTVSPIEDGTAFGQFDIPADFAGSYLHVKGYTRWMLNFDSAFLYNKDIKILSSATSTKGKTTITPEINFFPEGGDMIAGVVNKIAFKANDQFGRPIKIKGQIKNNKGSVVSQLTDMHDGMGYFFLKPEGGDSFSASWTDEKGTNHVSQLPPVKNSGVALKVAISGSKRDFFVSAAANSSNAINSVHVIGTMYQQPVFNITKQLTNGIAEGIIPTENLPSGILVITVFDNEWKPLAERITYINNEEYKFEPEMTVEHWGLNKRARNEILITVPDSLQANLSISVTDAAIGHDTSDNIISHLMLTGQLRGKINNPSYYFKNNSDSLMQQLDLVMLTHGWRRFDWEKLSKGEFPVINYKRDTSYLSLSGRVLGATPTQLRGAGAIVLMINQKKTPMKIFTAPVQPDGYFNDPNVIIFDTARVYYQLGKLKDVTVQFMQNRLMPFSNNTKASGLHYNWLADTSGSRYQEKLSDAAEQEAQFMKAKVLQTVNIKANPKTSLNEIDKRYTSGLFSGGDAKQFDLLNDPFSVSSLDVFQYLQGKVAGLQINTTSNPPTLSWRGGSPDLFVNEMPTTADMVQTIPVSDIAYVKVFQPPFMGAVGGGAGGAIAIYTRKGGDEKPEPGKGLSNNAVSGYTAIRQFYSPDYESLDQENNKKDLRSTLYWNPMIMTTPGKNKVMLKFFNNDITQSFRVVIEGMTKDGRLTHYEQLME